MTSKVVLELVERYASLWRVVAMDSFYSRCTLFYALFLKRLTAVGAVRSDSKYYPTAQFGELSVDSCDSLRCKNFPELIAVVHRNQSRTKLYLSTATSVLANGDIELLRAHAGKKRADSDPKYTVPSVYLLYNKFMSGVDLANQRVANISMWRKSNRWWLSILYHFMCVSISNGWYLYQHYGVETGPEFTLQQWRFRLITELMGTYQTRSKPGPAQVSSDSSCELIRSGDKSAHPCSVCHHRVGKRGEKSIPHGSRTTFICHKCGKYVCDTKKKDCFKYHKLRLFYPCLVPDCKRTQQK